VTYGVLKHKNQRPRLAKKKYENASVRTAKSIGAHANP